MKKSGLSKQLPLHSMLLIPVILLCIYSYVPMLGIVMAFMDYQPGFGFLKSQWVGLDNFRQLLLLPDTMQVVWNTLFIAGMKVAGNMLAPVIFALLLNEVRFLWFKRSVQTITYLPYFISWVVLSGILIDFLSPEGIVNNFIRVFGAEPIFFLGNDKWFPYTLVITDIWKNFGFNAVIYLASLTGIDPSLYEAAYMDGAGRWKQTIYVTLPGIAPFIALMSVLSLGSILNAGFDQVFNLYSPMVYRTGDIIDTLVYRIGILDAQYSLSTAVGLFKSVVSLILIALSYKLADKYTNYRVF